MRIASTFERAGPISGGLQHGARGPGVEAQRPTLSRRQAEGLDLAIAKGWLIMHERGTFVRFTQAGADLFA